MKHSFLCSIVNLWYMISEFGIMSLGLYMAFLLKNIIGPYEIHFHMQHSLLLVYDRKSCMHY
jgi:hypothetical protein